MAVHTACFAWVRDCQPTRSSSARPRSSWAAVEMVAWPLRLTVHGPWLNSEQWVAAYLSASCTMAASSSKGGLPLADGAASSSLKPTDAMMERTLRMVSGSTPRLPRNACSSNTVVGAHILQGFQRQDRVCTHA